MFYDVLSANGAVIPPKPPASIDSGPPALELNDPVFHVPASLGASLLGTETPIPLNLILDATEVLLTTKCC